MKIKKLILTNYSFTKLNLLNLKYYLKFAENDLSKFFINKNINKLNLNIKKTLKIIFEYHTLKKNIVFVGFDDINNLKFSSLFKNLNYNFLNKKIWINGILCNPNSLKYYLNSKRLERFIKKENIFLLKKFMNIKNKINLIIVYNRNYNFEIIKESEKLKIPVIHFFEFRKLINYDNKISTYCKNDYNVSKFVYFLISSIFFRILKNSLRKKK